MLPGQRVVAAHPRCSKSLSTLRVFIVQEWIEQVMKRFQDDGLLTDESMAEMRNHLVKFQESWIEAHDLSYIHDPAPYLNLIQTSVTAFVFFCPVAFVDFFQLYSFLPFTLIFHTFLGLNTLATHMRNPFGEDAHDIKLAVLLFLTELAPTALLFLTELAPTVLLFSC
jgi:predicted membrane chloride channel (bestrophin family)